MYIDRHFLLIVMGCDFKTAPKRDHEGDMFCQQTCTLMTTLLSSLNIAACCRTFFSLFLVMNDTQRVRTRIILLLFLPEDLTTKPKGIGG